MLSLPSHLLAGAELAINQFLQLDAGTLTRLRAMTGKVIKVELDGLNLGLFILPGAGGIQLLGECAVAPDAIIRGAPASLLRAGLDQQGRGTVLRGDVEVTGDVELGRQFEEILRNINIDWEEQLSRISGDVVAHQLGNVVRGALSWGRHAVTTLREDLADYLQEESRTMPLREEVDAHLHAVDLLRGDVDRLEVRVRRLLSWVEQREREA